MNYSENLDGFIKLPRRFQKSKCYFGDRFNHSQCLLDLMLLAEWKENREFYIRGVKVSLQRGQLAMPVRDLAIRWSMDAKTVQKRLKDFEADGVITIDRTTKVNIITIVDYDGDGENAGQTSAKHAGTPTEILTIIPTNFPTETPTQTPTETPTLSLRIKEERKKKEKEHSFLSQARGEGGGDAGDSFLKAFFAEERRDIIEQLCVNWQLKRIQLQAVARECVVEWKITGTDFSDDFSTLAQRLLKHMRSKVKYDRDNIRIPGAPEGTVDAAEVDGRIVYLGHDEYIHADGFRTYCNGRVKVPLSAPPRPGNGWWWQPITNSWCDVP